MFGNLGNLKEMQEKMQQDMASVKVEEEVGGITVEATGDKRITNISIKPELLEAGDAEMIEDLLLEAVNRALDKAEEQAQGKMKDMMSGMFPGGLGNLFG